MPGDTPSKDMVIRQLLVVVGLVIMAMHAIPGRAQTVSAAEGNAPATCTALVSADFSQLQDAPTQIGSATFVKGSDGESPYCRVQGYIWPQIRFELRLPISDWNGKFFEVGCGGSCGNTAWTFWCPVRRGYACIASDMGNESGGNDSFLWAYNNLQAQVDLDTRGPHATALAGKAITERYFGRSVAKAYFMGCSNGGTQALIEAQRFPWDFNGIIDIAGVPNKSDASLENLWWLRALRDNSGKPLLSHPDVQLVHNAVLAKCDLDDGVRDGVISDPYHCGFDPSELLCRDGQTTACLNQDQVEAVKKIYAGPPPNDNKKNYIRGAVPGSELDWLENSQENWIREVMRYMAFSPPAGPRWSIPDFDFDHDYKRLGVSETFWDASNPDLRKFKDAGGKLILAHGLADADVTPAAQIDYYNMVEKTMGGRIQTQEFARLFMVPGMKHCTAGPGAFAIDYVGYLENWAEYDHPPDKLIGAHVDSSYLQSLAGGQLSPQSTGDLDLQREELTVSGAVFLMAKFPLDSSIPVTFTRAIYPYPVLAKYKGAGDPNKAESFKAVGR
jgi:hypothetical protein